MWRFCTVICSDGIKLRHAYVNNSPIMYINIPTIKTGPAELTCPPTTDRAFAYMIKFLKDPGEVKGTPKS